MEIRLKEWLEELVNASLHQMVLSNPVTGTDIIKIRIRPVMLRDQLMFQTEERTEKQAFHKNMNQQECVSYIAHMLESTMRQAQVESAVATGNVLVSKKGKMTIKLHRKPAKMQTTAEVSSHNRQKKYIIEEGKPVMWLEDLGIMTAEGRVVRAKYDKFRQINRFLEFIEDVLPVLSGHTPIRIIDFGCGKSYLTFAMYYYLHELKGYEVEITGLDLKHDVIEQCQRLAKKYGFEHLNFLYGDIATYDGAAAVDMVVTLHACDTATDYALEKAVRWNASVILSVPCCQHEWNKQITNELFAPVLQYGLIKERMSALLTDAVRAQLLEQMGYRTQILEFIDMEHTPKNILIRAVKSGKKHSNQKEIQDILDFLHVEPTLSNLFHQIESEK